MTDADALLAAILAEPDDDGPRLVYADWLEEHGEPERAEFMRVQLARAAQRPGRCVHGKCPDAAKCCEVWCEGADRLARREGELLAAHRKRWLTAAAPPGARYWQTGTEQGWALPHVLSDGGTGRVGVPVEFRRGFVEAVRCPLADWLAHGPAVVRRQPVTRVDVTSVTLWTISPGPLAGYRCWARVDLPPEVWDLLKAEQKGTAAVAAMYPTEAAARAALSAALLAWAKRPAAAPPPAAGAGR